MNRMVASVGVVGAVVGVFLLGQDAPQWWLGAGLLGGVAAFVAAHAAERLHDVRRWMSTPQTIWRAQVIPATVVREVAAVAIIFGLAAAMMPEAALGDRPVNHDHAVHFYKAWHLQHQLLGGGGLWGWSHQWFAGYPVDYLYPIGGDLFVIAVHWASLGLLGLSRAYAVGMWLFWGMSGYAVYRFGSSGLGWSVGMLAAVFLMTDTATFRAGGWDFALNWGVWPQSLSVGLAMWAMAQAPGVVGKRRWRPVATFGLLMGLSLLSHPLQVLHFAVVGPVILVAYWLSGGPQPWWRAAYRTVLGYGVGIAIGMLWLLPFLSVKDQAEPYGDVWKTTAEIARGFYDLDLLTGTWSVAIAAGMIGLVGLLFSRRFQHMLVGLAAVAFTLGASVDVLVGLHLLELTDTFQFVQFSRFVILLKPYLFIAAAYAVVVGVSGLARGMYAGDADPSDPSLEPLFDKQSDEQSDQTLNPQDDQRKAPAGGADADRGGLRLWQGWVARPWTALVQVALVVVALAPVGGAFLYRFGDQLISRNLTEASERPYQRDRDRLVEWINQTYPDGKPFFRIALVLRDADHSFADLGRRIPFPLYKRGFTPASNFKYKMESIRPAMLDALNVRYLLALRPLHGSDYTLAKRFGSIRLYAYDHWRRQPFEVIEGAGEVSVVKFAANEVVLRAGPNARGRLRLNVSDFPRWHATLDGQDIDIGATDIGATSVADDPATNFMTVELRPGTYRFEFSTGPPEWIALVLFMLGIAAVVALVVADRGRPRRVSRWLDGFDAWLGGLVDAHGVWAGRVIAAGVVAGLVALAGLARWAPPLETPDAPAGQQVQYDFADHLDDASVAVQHDGRLDACPQILDAHECGDKPWQHVERKAVGYRQKQLRRCIWAHPQSRGPVVISFADVPAGNQIVGWFGVAKSGKQAQNKPVSLDISVDGIPAAHHQTSVDARIEPFQMPLEASGGSVDVQFSVSAKRVGMRHFCFNAQITGGAP